MAIKYPFVSAEVWINTWPVDCVLVVQMPVNTDQEANLPISSLSQGQKAHGNRNTDNNLSIFSRLLKHNVSERKWRSAVVRSVHLCGGLWIIDRPDE